MPSPDKKARRLYKLSLKKMVVSLGLFFIITFSLGYAIAYMHTTNLMKQEILTIKPIRENNQEYHFIYPLLYYDLGDVKQFFEDHGLETAIHNYVETQYQSRNAQSISVAVRNFSQATWAQESQDVQYHPGSLLKVLIMMAYFREAELNPPILNSTLLYNNAVNQQVNSLAFDLPTNLKVGTYYPINQLMQSMIANSDNGAETLLIDNVDHTILDQAYIDLGIRSPDTVTGDYTLSPAQYINFLRILYNATYLSERYSEISLSLMSQSTYHDGISAGVPQGTEVAQKYGERVDASSTTIQAIELHDCGIVYAPNDPYALCIMTKGNDLTKLTSILKGISSLVYNYYNYVTQK